MDSHILDNLEDAQEEYDRHKRQLKWGVGLFYGGVVPAIGWLVLLSVMSSMGQNWGNAAGFPAVLLFIVAVVGGVIVAGTWFEDLPRSRKALKKAQRAHRNALMRSGEL